MDVVNNLTDLLNRFLLRIIAEGYIRLKTLPDCSCFSVPKIAVGTVLSDDACEWIH